MIPRGSSLPSRAAGGSTASHDSSCQRTRSTTSGEEAAAAELRQHNGYSWIYGQILAEPRWFADFLIRHDVAVPEQPPVPRRYCGEDWWKDIVEPATT